MTVRLICVDPDLIEHFWPHVREFIVAAFAKGRGDGDESTVLDGLQSRRSLLWVVWDSGGRSILAAVTTELLKTPSGLVCRITSCGGTQLKRWAHLLADIEAYAKAEGCICVRWEGRKGWKAFFTGYREPWIVLEKRL